MPHISTRRATAADAPGIARVHVQAWREAYAHALPADALAGLDEQRRADVWESIIEEGVTDVWVAVAGDEIAGWASASAGRDTDSPVDRELEGIYVLADLHGSGAGQLLLDAAIGLDSAYLWILDDNPRADAFYRRNGFVRDGTERDYLMLGHPVRIVRMVRVR